MIYQIRLARFAAQCLSNIADRLVLVVALGIRKAGGKKDVYALAQKLPRLIELPQN